MIEATLGVATNATLTNNKAAKCVGEILFLIITSKI